MPPELVAYITDYGYITIFLLVFIQELGVPNPIPNELILLFAGYLASINHFSFFWVITTAILADVIGTTIIYFVFYSFGQKIIDRFNSVVPNKKIHKLTLFLSNRGRWGIYIGRLLPLVRGYASVAAGLLRLPPTEFITMVFLSAITWSGGYVILGYILGPQWQKVEQYIGFKNSLLVIISAIILYVTTSWIMRHFKSLSKN